jgi:hypothetical protein
VVVAVPRVAVVAVLGVAVVAVQGVVLVAAQGVAVLGVLRLAVVVVPRVAVALVPRIAVRGAPGGAILVVGRAALLVVPAVAAAAIARDGPAFPMPDCRLPMPPGFGRHVAVYVAGSFRVAASSRPLTSSMVLLPAWLAGVVAAGSAGAPPGALLPCLLAIRSEARHGSALPGVPGAMSTSSGGRA